MPKRILVTGKNGQLGQSILAIASAYPQYDFVFVGREELDLSSSQSTADYFSKNAFDVMINCAAYTAVDKAESEPELANQINHLAVKQLAEIAKQQNASLIHISTDYVFDGTQHRPYIESEATAPQGVYGDTKLKGEQAMQSVNPKGCILRTSWVYSEFGNNFVKTMLRLGKERDSLNVIFDQVGSPTYATDLAEAILAVLSHTLLGAESQSMPQVGHSELAEGSSKSEEDSSVTHQNDAGVKIYHYSNEGVCSWYDFAKAIFELSGMDCKVFPIETKDYPTPAKRPHYSLMNKAKIKQAYGLDIPYWRDSLKICLKELEK
jgi:dTDP-4-dehydrorhamnose reductase